MVYRQTVSIDSNMDGSGSIVSGQFTPSTYSQDGRYLYEGNSIIDEVDWNIKLLSDANFRLYSCKIKQGDDLYCNFIPCYRKSDGEIGLYDSVNNVFYTNSGSGAFTKGENTRAFVEKQIWPAGWKPGANTRLYLPLNSTDNFTDKSGNSYTITNVGNVQFGTYGGVDCAYFTGSTNSYATLNNFAFNSDTNWTISFWGYYIAGDYPSFFASTSNVGFGKSFKLGPETNNQLNYEVYGSNGDGGGTQGSLVVDNTMSYKNVWCYYCLVMDGVENNVAHFKAYINNTQVSHYDGGKWLYTSTRPNYCFGSDPYYGVGGRLGTFYLSNFIIENKSWTTQERTDYYNQTKGNYGL